MTFVLQTSNNVDDYVKNQRKINVFRVQTEIFARMK